MANYKIYGTDEMYSGMVVDIGGFMYSTIGGALEGDSLQLVAGGGSNPNINQNNNSNPVTRTFVSRMVYYRAVSGTGVPIGTSLHEHQDGTIMVGNHNNPNYDMNAPNNVVTTTNPNPPIGSGTGGGNNNNQTTQGGGGMY